MDGEKNRKTERHSCHVYDMRGEGEQEAKWRRYISQSCRDTQKQVIVKMHRTTYWGYSLSWYNLAGERARWWDQIKRERDRERKRRERETFYILQGKFCRQPSNSLGATIWGQATSQYHPFPFSQTSVSSLHTSLDPQTHPRHPKNTTEGKLHSFNL